MQVDPTITVAVIVAGSTLLANWQRRRDKREDWKRQDEVARRLQSADDAITAEAAKTGRKLNAIHTLVNSKLTAMIRMALDASMSELALLKELIDVRRVNGQEPSEESLAAVTTARAKVSELRIALEDRLEQTDAVIGPT